MVAVPCVEYDDCGSVEVRAATTLTPENVRWEHGLRIVRMQIDGLVLQFVVGALDVVAHHEVRHLFLQRDRTLVVGDEDLVKIWYLQDSWKRALGFV